MRDKLLNATLLHFQAKKAEASANLEIYMSNPAGVAEHPNIVEELVSLTKQVVEADECITLLLSKQGYTKATSKR